MTTENIAIVSPFAPVAPDSAALPLTAAFDAAEVTNAVAVESKDVAEKKTRRKVSLAEKIETLEKRIADDSETLEQLLNLRDNAEKLANLAAGSVIQAKFGRKFKDKDTTRIVSVTVLAVKRDENDDVTLAVISGEGFDAEINHIGLGAVVSVE